MAVARLDHAFRKLGCSSNAVYASLSRRTRHDHQAFADQEREAIAQLEDEAREPLRFPIIQEVEAQVRVGPSAPAKPRDRAGSPPNVVKDGAIRVAASRSRLLTRRQLGDRKVQQSYGTSGVMTTYEPMDAASRALEEKYGYISALHAGNWGATVLDVLQGRKPDFPAGARPTEAMYEVPPAQDRIDTGW